MNRLDRLNRVVAIVVSALLLAAGTYGLIRSYDGFGAREARDPLLLEGVRDFVGRNSGWFWWVAAAGALLIAWLGWRWLRAQLLPSPSLRELTVVQGAEGRTTLPARAVAEAVKRDLESDPGVSSARVRLVGSESSPVLDVRAAATDASDPGAVRTRIEGEVLGRARAALERDDLRAQVHLRLGDPSARSVS